MQAEAQHGGRADALLGGDTGQRGGLPLRGELLHVHPASPVLLHRGDELQGLALALRHQDGGQDDGQTAASGHQRPADEERGDLEPQQVRPRSERKRQVVLHEHLVRQYYEQNSHIVLIDTGNSYQGLCELIHRKTKGEDGIYYTYTEEKPISFNPFFTDDYKFSVEKKDSIKTLLLALWKGEDEKVTKTESGELGSAVSAYIRRIQQNRDIAPSFDTFYEYMLNDYRKELAARDIKVSREDFNIDNFLTTLRQYYKGGRYDFLLNSNENIDLLHKRFIVFEIDAVKDNAELFPVVTIIIMEAFINKLRRLKGVRKMLICEEAWKALSSPSMSEYLKYLYKTVRKYFGEAIVVTQEVDDIISSPIVKEAIITNSDCKILLDQKKYMNKFDGIQSMLGLTDKEKSQILSINLANHPGRKYKEVWIGLNGVQSAVYATEVSAAEYLTYTTEESEKTEVFALAEELGGDLELAIKRLAETKYK